MYQYHIPRTKRGGKTPKRIVPGRGGGTWKEPIMDKDKNVEGYRQNLAYYKDLKNNISWEFLVLMELRI